MHREKIGDDHHQSPLRQNRTFDRRREATFKPGRLDVRFRPIADDQRTRLVMSAQRQKRHWRSFPHTSATTIEWTIWT